MIRHVTSMFSPCGDAQHNIATRPRWTSIRDDAAEDAADQATDNRSAVVIATSIIISTSAVAAVPRIATEAGIPAIATIAAHDATSADMPARDTATTGVASHCMSALHAGMAIRTGGSHGIRCEGHAAEGNHGSESHKCSITHFDSPGYE